MARSREITIFSTSFLDLLSCGMGAVIILLIIFLSRLRVEPRDSTAFATVVFRVDYGDTRPTPFRESWEVDGRPVLRIAPSGDAAAPYEYRYLADAPTRGGDGLSIPPPGSASPDLTVSVSSSASSGAASQPTISLPFASQNCVGARPNPPKSRRETSVVLPDWESPRRLTYTVERNPLPAGSIHYFDDALQFHGGGPPGGAGSMAHVRTPGGPLPGDIQYSFPLRIEVVVYTTQSSGPYTRKFIVPTFIAPGQNQFRIALLLDPDASPGADPVKEPTAP